MSRVQHYNSDNRGGKTPGRQRSPPPCHILNPMPHSSYQVGIDYARLQAEGIQHPTRSDLLALRSTGAHRGRGSGRVFYAQRNQRAQQYNRPTSDQIMQDLLIEHQAKMNGTYTGQASVAQQKKQWNAQLGDQRGDLSSHFKDPRRQQGKKERSAQHVEERQQTSYNGYNREQARFNQHGSQRDNRAAFTGQPRGEQQRNNQHRSDRPSTNNEPKHGILKKENALRGSLPTASEERNTQRRDQRRVRFSTVDQPRRANERIDQPGRLCHTAHDASRRRQEEKRNTQHARQPENRPMAIEEPGLDQERNAQPVVEKRREESELIIMEGKALSDALRCIVREVRLDPEEWEQSPALLRIFDEDRPDKDEELPDDTADSWDASSATVLKCEPDERPQFDENGQEIWYGEPIPELDEPDEARSVEAVVKAVAAKQAPAQPDNSYSAESLAKAIHANQLESLLECGLVIPVVPLVPAQAAQAPVVPQAAPVPQHAVVLAALPAPVVVESDEDNTTAAQIATDSGLGSCSDSVDCDGDKFDYQKLLDDENEEEIVEQHVEEIVQIVEPTVIIADQQSTEDKIALWESRSEGWKVAKKGDDWYTVPQHRNWRWIKDEVGGYTWEICFTRD